VSRIAYVNGRYLPQPQASVNIEDRGYQFADGIYEVLYYRHGRFIDEDLHLDRLDRSLKEIRLRPPMGRAALKHVLQEVARRNRIGEGLLYMQITRGVARREHAFPADSTPPALVVTIRRVPPYPTDIRQWTMEAITQPDERWARCDIKSVGLLPNVLARQAAREQGAGEAILVDADGMVMEGAATSWPKPTSRSRKKPSPPKRCAPRKRPSSPARPASSNPSSRSTAPRSATAPPAP
jgi:D-alanine transaminase